MSLKLVEDTAKENPGLLVTNLGSTTFKHTMILIGKLRAAGHLAFPICKSPGEGQYTPEGFVARPVQGLDGKLYPCSGFSHDAIWCDGKQFDTLVAANETERPIYHREGDPNWSFDPADGPPIIARPVWDEIPAAKWRNNNPAFKGELDIPVGLPGPIVVTPPPAPTFRFPTYAELGDDDFFRKAIGAPLEEDSLAVGATLNEGSTVWSSRGSWLLIEAFFRLGNHSEKPAIVRKLRNEWREVLRGAYPEQAGKLPPL